MAEISNKNKKCQGIILGIYHVLTICSCVTDIKVGLENDMADASGISVDVMGIQISQLELDAHHQTTHKDVNSFSIRTEKKYMTTGVVKVQVDKRCKLSYKLVFNNLALLQLKTPVPDDSSITLLPSPKSGPYGYALKRIREENLYVWSWMVSKNGGLSLDADMFLIHDQEVMKLAVSLSEYSKDGNYTFGEGDMVDYRTWPFIGVRSKNFTCPSLGAPIMSVLTVIGLVINTDECNTTGINLAHILQEYDGWIYETIHEFYYGGSSRIQLGLSSYIFTMTLFIYINTFIFNCSLPLQCLVFG